MMNAIHLIWKPGVQSNLQALESYGGSEGRWKER